MESEKTTNEKKRKKKLKAQNGRAGKIPTDATREKRECVSTTAS